MSSVDARRTRRAAPAVGDVLLSPDLAVGHVRAAQPQMVAAMMMAMASAVPASGEFPGRCSGPR